MAAQVLLRFAEVLGIEPQEVKDHETQERLVLSLPVPIRNLRRLSTELIETLVSTLGSALRLSVGVEGAEPLLRIERGVVAPDIRSGLEAMGGLADGLNLQVTLEIDKAEILEEMATRLDGYHVLFYLFLENVSKLLRAPVPQLDTLLFSGAHAATVVVVADCDIACRGPLLSVMDLGRLGDPQAPSPAPSTRLRERLDSLRALASDNLNWLGFRLANVTPVHMMCKCEGAQADELVNVLANRALQILIVYTANTSSLDAAGMSGVYASPQQSVRLVIGDTPLATTLQSDIARLALWLGGAAQADKLSIFQTVVAREITGEDPEQNFATFVERLPYLLNEARWHYRVFVEGRISKHFEKVEAVGAYIADTAQQIAATLDSAVKGFVDTLLATVGVVILTLLASLVEGRTQGLIFTVGMWVYAVYLLVFQLLYRMGHLYRSYRLIVSESEQRLLPYSVVLGKRKTAELTQVLERREGYFVTMFWLTVVLYIAVIVAVLALGGALPSAIGQPEGVVPIPTAATPV